MRIWLRSRAGPCLVRIGGTGEFKEMVPHDGQGDGLAEVVAMLAEGLGKEFPVLATVVAEQALPEQRTAQSQYIGEDERGA